MNIHAPVQMIKMWFTAQELADAAEAGLLQDMPADKRSIDRMIKREDWHRYHALVRTETGRGGRITQYHIELLPLHVRVGYLTSFLKVASGDCENRPASVAGPSENLTERARLERDARLALIRLADRFCAMSALPVRTADGLFAEIYNCGRIDMPSWVRQTIGAVSARSLARWRGKDREGAAIGHDPALNRKGCGLLETANDGKVKLFVVAWMARNPALSAKIIRGYVEDEFGAELVDRAGELRPVPSPRTFQLFMAGLRETEKVVLTKITDPDTYRSTMKLVGTGAYSWVTEPNQMWMIDASPADVLLKDGRHSIYACLDLATRRFVVTLSRTPRSSAVALMIRKATLKWGVAKIIKTDNGSDFTSYEIERLFASLDIKPDPSEAYTPEEKGHVERVIKTFQHEVCPQLPGYIGHNVGERKAIEGRKSFAQRLGASDEVLFEVALTAEELQLQIDDWLEHVYHHRGHGGLGDRSPNEVAAASSTVARRVDERALDILLMPVAGKDGHRTMTKQGIEVDRNYYMTGLVLAGTDVFVRLDPIDMGKIYVFSGDQRQFLDVAVCPKLSDINRTDFVRARKQEYAELVSAREKEIKAEVRRLQKGPSGLERTIRLAKRKSAERDAAHAAANANVIPLPRREEQHVTPQIAAALDAATLPQKPIEPAPLNEMAAKLHAAIVREAEFKAVSKVIHLDPEASLTDRARKFKWALKLEEQIAAGAVLDDDTAIQLVRFQATGDYQSMKDCLKDFGLENTLRMF